MRLRRNDGKIYLERWGIECRWGGIFFHRMAAPDPGLWLHDHPFWFVSFVVKTGYSEYRALARDPENWEVTHRNRFSLRSMRLDEIHRIVALQGKTSWSIIIHGPKKRPWGFFTDEGWVAGTDLETDSRAVRNEL